MRTEESTAGARTAGFKMPGLRDPHVVSQIAGSPEKTRSTPSRWAASGPEHADRFLGGRRIQIRAPGNTGPHGACQPKAGGVNGECVGVDGRDERTAVHVAVDRAGLFDLGDRSDAGDHRRMRVSAACGLAEQVWPL